ncbi:hypothetical protein A6302_03398 [Methylobrevis pamukkalensis]|uniref:Uncharacterized protein n=1 Tax=Methylobrevis pamukkalensis TaxID=1439726 RepID=A0A1E3GZ53_9HYPH|nr:hypothetical protein A6302_03398 [Methylobrevis pamukkalensis]
METSGRGTGPGLMPLPDQPAEDARELIFRAGLDDVAPRSVAVVSTADILARLAESRQALAPDPEDDPAQADLLALSDRDDEIEAILTEMLADPEAPFAQISVLYQDFLVRCRIRRVKGPAMDLPAFRKRLAIARAGVEAEEVDGDAWNQATLVAAALPEDMRGVFLLVARAGLRKAPCPSDEEIARAYGTRSPSRARRLLAYMEERGFLATASDLRASASSSCRISAGRPRRAAPTRWRRSRAGETGTARPLSPFDFSAGRCH